MPPQKCRAGNLPRFWAQQKTPGVIGAVFINKKTAGLLPGGFLALETKLSFFGSLFGGFFSGCFFNNGFFCHFFNNSFFNCCFF